MPNAPLFDHRSGLDLSQFKHDDALQKFCSQRFHAWIAGAQGKAFTLTDPPAGEFAFDATLAAINLALRLEYKWDRYKPFNLAAELVAKDRGREPQLGYLFKQGYDWLVYTYVAKTPLMFVMDAQCVRKYVFQFWRERGFGATHCQNGNRDRTAAWSLLVPVEAMHAFLKQFGMSHRLELPVGIFDVKVPTTSLASLEAGRPEVVAMLEALLVTRNPRAWKPSPEQWEGLVPYMLQRNALRTNFKPHQIHASEFTQLDWPAMAQAQGLMLA